MNDAEVKRLAHAINELRPSWPISSLTTFISRSLSNRNYRDAAVALVYVALDADGAGNYVTETPRRVLEAGPWWKAAEINQTHIRPGAPKKHEQCDRCGGWKNNCACQHESRAWDAADQGAPMSQADALKAARDALGARAV